MKKFPILLAASFLLSACVSTQEVYLADGSPGYHITCNSNWLSMGDCQQKAGEMCGPSGYKVYSQTGEYIPYTTSDAVTTANSNRHGSSSTTDYSTASGSIVQRDLFIRCNGVAAKKEALPD